MLWKSAKARHSMAFFYQHIDLTVSLSLFSPAAWRVSATPPFRLQRKATWNKRIRLSKPNRQVLAVPR